MKKIIAIITAIAGLAVAGEYALTKTITASKFVIKRLSADVSRPEPSFTIQGEWQDADGRMVEPKMVRMTIAQVRQIMPQIDAIMSNATTAITANISAIAGE
jgi:hypothetical protein